MLQDAGPVLGILGEVEKREGKPAFYPQVTNALLSPISLRIELHPNAQVLTKAEKPSEAEQTWLRERLESLDREGGEVLIAAPEFPLRRFSNGGLIPLVGKEAELVVLVQRSLNAPTNPGAFSGFLGAASSLEECLLPSRVIWREAREEIFITSAEGEAIYPLPDENLSGILQKAALWRLAYKFIDESHLRPTPLPAGQAIRVSYKGVNHLSTGIVSVEPHNSGINIVGLLTVSEQTEEEFLAGHIWRDCEDDGKGNLLNRAIHVFTKGAIRGALQALQTNPDPQQVQVASLCYYQGGVAYQGVESAARFSPAIWPALHTIVEL
jgi:hypothetical protein